jgi:hypothetical protein
VHTALLWRSNSAIQFRTLLDRISGIFDAMPRKLIKNTDEMKRLAGTVREGDGVDPREEAKRPQRERRQGGAGITRGAHQQKRFASQVQDVIESALLAAATPILNALSVRELAIDKGAILVVVVPRDPLVLVDLAKATKALKNATSMLRREVASAITRKETPNLKFVVLPDGAAKLEE